jgi:hypothetical protein
MNSNFAAKKLNVLIASHLEPGLVQQLRDVDERLDVVYRPELLASPRYSRRPLGFIYRIAPQQRPFPLTRAAAGEKVSFIDSSFHFADCNAGVCCPKCSPQP